MKGIVLAGGTGSRLHPLTTVTNKHLLPVYNRPMICFPIEKLIDAGIRDIMIVAGGENAGRFLNLLSNGAGLGLDHLEYAYQEVAGGIPDALRLCRHFADGQKICVILGDNIFEGSLRDAAAAFDAQSRGARVLLSDTARSNDHPCAIVKDGSISAVEDSASESPDGATITGVYFFDSALFDKIDQLKPSWRGELEILDAIRLYLNEGSLEYSTLEGWWVAAGTFDSLLEANRKVAEQFSVASPVTSSP